MTLPKEDKSNNLSLQLVLLLVGIAGLGCNLYYKYDRYYLGEKLIEKVIQVDKPPVLITIGKGGTSRYAFSGVGYFCQFWLSHGALTVIRQHESIGQKVKSIKKGDTISLKIRLTDEQFLQDVSGRPRCIELTKNQETIIRAADVEAEDRKWYYINFGISVVALIIWGIIQLRQVYIKGKQYFQEPV